MSKSANFNIKNFINLTKQPMKLTLFTMLKSSKALKYISEEQQGLDVLTQYKFLDAAKFINEKVEDFNLLKKKLIRDNGEIKTMIYAETKQEYEDFVTKPEKIGAVEDQLKLMLEKECEQDIATITYEEIKKGYDAWRGKDLKKPEFNLPTWLLIDLDWLIMRPVTKKTSETKMDR